MRFVVTLLSCGAAMCVATSPANAQTPGNPRPWITLDVDSCAGVPRADVVRLLALELGADVVDVPSRGTTRILVGCGTVSLRLHVDDPITGKSVDRSIDTSVYPAGARARLLALALSELVTASWSELITHPSPAVPPASSPPPDDSRAAVLAALRVAGVTAAASEPAPAQSPLSPPTSSARPLTPIAVRPHARRTAQYYSALDGSTGLFHIATTDPFRPVTFRAGFFFGGYGGTALPSVYSVPTDHTSRVQGTLTLGLSPARYLDLFAAMSIAHTETDVDPARSITAIGNGNLGATGILPIVPGFAIGASASLRTQTGPDGLNWAALGGDFRVQTTIDLARITGRMPLRVHANFGYRAENGAAAVDRFVQARQMGTPGWNAECLQPISTDPVSNPRSSNPACWQDVTSFERLAWGIQRADHATISLAVEAWLPSVTWLRAFVEFAISAPIVRSGYVCYGSQTSATDRDTCLSQGDMLAANPAMFTLGARAAIPGLAGLGAIAALDVAAPSAARTVRELAPTLPWMVAIGVEYTFTPHR